MEPESKTAFINGCGLTCPWPQGNDKKVWGFPTGRVKHLNTQVCRRMAPLHASYLCGQPLKDSNGNRKIISGSMTLAGTSPYWCSGGQNADGLKMILINIYHAQGTEIQVYNSWALVLHQQLPNTTYDLHNTFLCIMLSAFIMFLRNISVYSCISQAEWISRDSEEIQTLPYSCTDWGIFSLHRDFSNCISQLTLKW